MSHPPQPAASLMERKRRLVQQRIIAAADELFSANGFENVSVTDIAARADVGRTTFFRYFGDKTEVVFAREREVLGSIATLTAGGLGAARTTTEAVELLRPVVLEICDRVTSDDAEYERHARLLALHPELQARAALKAQQIAEMLSGALSSSGTDERIATLAANIALACYQTGLRSAATAGALTDETRAAFEAALVLGRR
jgi:AcrR family transcriptional regulator